MLGTHSSAAAWTEKSAYFPENKRAISESRSAYPFCSSFAMDRQMTLCNMICLVQIKRLASFVPA